MNSSDLITAASLIAGFGVTVLMFRLQRELQISDENWKQPENLHPTPTWLALADYLVIVAILISLLFAVVPLLLSSSLRLPRVASLSATILLAGYVPSILAHYRFLYWLHKSRGPFLFWEVLLVLITFVSAAVAGCIAWNRYQ